MAITSTIQSLTSGNPALDAASALSDQSASLSTSSDERLYLTRPRSTSSDTTNRGQHGYIRLKGAVGQNVAPSTISKAESSSYAESLSLLTSGTGGSGYDKFLITGISASMEEKVQITEVFGDVEVAYFFGRAPMMFNVTGTLIDSPDNSWFTDWIYAYNELFRGSKLAQNHELISLVLPNMTLDGAMTNFAWDQGSGNDVAISFRFTMLVSNMVPTPALGVDVAITDSANYVDFSNVPGFSSKSQINKIKSATTVLQTAGSSISDKAAALSYINSAASATKSISSIASSLSIGGSDGGLFGSTISSIDGLTKKVTSGLDSIFGSSSFLGGISSNLSAIRANLFLPVYGVMNSLSKLVGAVFGSNGISSLLSKLTAPIRNILGDITRFANQAVAIANMITSGVTSLGRNIKSGFGVTQAYQQAASAVSKASGTLASLPGSIGDSISTLFNGGHIPASSAFLKSNPRATLSRTASLSSSSSATIGGPSAPLGFTLSPQLSILSKGSTQVKGAYL